MAIRAQPAKIECLEYGWVEYGRLHGGAFSNHLGASAGLHLLPESLGRRDLPETAPDGEGRQGAVFSSERVQI